MTAKEKADELIKDIQKVIYTGGAGHESTVSYNDIKNIAALCVDEIIKVCPYRNYDQRMEYEEQIGASEHFFISYWSKVKTSLKKL